MSKGPSFEPRMAEMESSFCKKQLREERGRHSIGMIVR